jgi:hypothetical protein
MDSVHNRESGTVHPFVGAGLGIYFLESKRSPRATKTGDSPTLFEWVEYLTIYRVSEGDVRYDPLTGPLLDNTDDRLLASRRPTDVPLRSTDR